MTAFDVLARPLKTTAIKPVCPVSRMFGLSWPKHGYSLFPFVALVLWWRQKVMEWGSFLHFMWASERDSRCIRSCEGVLNRWGLNRSVGPVQQHHTPGRGAGLLDSALVYRAQRTVPLLSRDLLCLLYLLCQRCWKNAHYPAVSCYTQSVPHWPSEYKLKTFFVWNSQVI